MIVTGGSRGKVKATITLGAPVRKPKSSAASGGGGSGSTTGGKQVGPLVVHQLDFSAEKLLINPDAFPELHEGDLVRIQHTTGSEGLSQDGEANVLQVKAGSLSANTECNVGSVGTCASKPIRWFSVLDSVADFFGMTAHREVSIERVTNTRKYELGIITVSFSKQYLSSPDMWRLVSRFNNRFTTTGMMLDLGSGVEAKVGELFDINKQPIRAGLITIRPDGSGTKVVFRSRSAHMHILLQMSTEMWEFSPTGDLYFEKAVAGFLQTLWQRWEELEVTHAVTIVMFSRLIFEMHTQGNEAQTTSNTADVGLARKSARTPSQQGDSVGDHKDPLCSGYSAEGAPYRDFYKVVAIMETADQQQPWSSFVLRLKTHFSSYRSELNQAGLEIGRAMAAAATANKGGVPVPVSPGRLSLSSEGNVLEAVNLSLNTLEQRYRGRDVTRTGESIIVVSPGTAVFETTRDLTNRTKHRCIEDGIAVNLVCLGPAPLHVVPLFLVRGASNPSSPAPAQQSRTAAERRAAAAMAAVVGSGSGGNVSTGRESPILHSLTKSGSLEVLSWGVGGSGGVAPRYGGFQRAHSFQGLAGLVDVAGGRPDELFAEMRSPAHARLAPAALSKSGGVRLPPVHYVVRWMVLSWFKPEPVSELMPRSVSTPAPPNHHNTDDECKDNGKCRSGADYGGEPKLPSGTSLDTITSKLPLLQEDPELADLTSLLGFLRGSSHTPLSAAAGRTAPAVSEAEFLEQCAAHDAQLMLKAHADSLTPSYSRSSALSGPVTGIAGTGLIRRSESGRLSSTLHGAYQRPSSGALRGVSETGAVYGLRKSASISELQSRVQRSPLILPSPAPVGFDANRTVPGRARFSPLLGPLSIGGSRMRPPPSPLLLGAASGNTTIATPIVEPLVLSPSSREGSGSQEDGTDKRNLCGAGGSSEDLSGSDVASLSSSPGVGSIGASGDSYESYSGVNGMMMLGDSSARSDSLGSSLSFDSSNSTVGMIRSASGLSLSRFDLGQSSNSIAEAGGAGRSRSKRHRSSDNPFQPSRAVFTGRFRGTSSWRRRWSHVYNPTYTPIYETADASACGVNYESLCTPAILPVTCVPPPYKVDETPTWRNIYQVSVPEISSTADGMPAHSPRSSPRSLSVSPAFVHAKELLEQLVSQRLRHDFQIVTDSADGHCKWNAAPPVTPSAAPASIGTSPATSAAYPRKQRVFSLGGQSRTSGSSDTGDVSGGFMGDSPTGYIGREYLMSRGNYFHKLTVDPEKPSEVTVSRYTPKNLPYGKEDAYVYAVWHEQHGQYEMRHGRFKAQDYDPSHGLNWNTLDTMISRLGASSSSELDYDQPTVLKASTKLFVLLSTHAKDPQLPLAKDIHASSAEIDANVRGSTDATPLITSSVDGNYFSASDQPSSPRRYQRSTSGRSISGEESPSPDKPARGGSGTSIGEARADVRSPEDRLRGFIESVRELQPMDVGFSDCTPKSTGSPNTVSAADGRMFQRHERDPPQRQQQLDFGVSGRSDKGEATGQHEWVWVRYDEDFDARRAFRFEVCWVELEGVAVKEFVNRLTSRARAFGFLLRELPVGAKADLCRPRQVVSFSPDPCDLEWPTWRLRAWAESRLESDFNFCYDRLLRWPMAPPCVGSLDSWMANPTAGDRSRWSNKSEGFDGGHAAVVASLQRLCLAALLCSTLRGSMWNSFQLQSGTRALVSPFVGIVRKIAAALPRCCEPAVELRVAQGQGWNQKWAWEVRNAQSYVRSCTPHQFVHRSGGALLGAGRSPTSDSIHRTLRWLEICTSSLTRSARQEARADFETLRQLCGVAWWCDEIVRNVVDDALELSQKN